MKTFKSIMILTVLAVLGILINWSFFSAFLYAEQKQAPVPQPAPQRPIVLKPLPDLVVVSAIVEPYSFADYPHPINKGITVPSSSTVRVLIRNQGGSAVTSAFMTKVKYELKKRHDGTTVLQDITFNFHWPLDPNYENPFRPGVAGLYYERVINHGVENVLKIKEVFVDSTNSVAESNEGNNKVTY